MTGHVWDGYIILANRRAWAAFPDDVKKIISAELDKSGADERADIAALSETLRKDLTAKGVEFFDVDRGEFRAALAKTPFYKEWKDKLRRRGLGPSRSRRRQARVNAMSHGAIDVAAASAG